MNNEVYVDPSIVPPIGHDASDAENKEFYGITSTPLVKEKKTQFRQQPVYELIDSDTNAIIGYEVVEVSDALYAPSVGQPIAAETVVSRLFSARSDAEKARDSRDPRKAPSPLRTMRTTYRKPTPEETRRGQTSTGTVLEAAVINNVGVTTYEVRVLEIGPNRQTQRYLITKALPDTGGRSTEERNGYGQRLSYLEEDYVRMPVRRERWEYLAPRMENVPLEPARVTITEQDPRRRFIRNQDIVNPLDDIVTILNFGALDRPPSATISLNKSEPVTQLN